MTRMNAAAANKGRAAARRKLKTLAAKGQDTPDRLEALANEYAIAHVDAVDGTEAWYKAAGARAFVLAALACLRAETVVAA